MSMTNPPFLDEASAAAAAAAAARDRQKKSTMACEMCRKRKVKCIFSDNSPSSCNFCAKYSFQCVVNTQRKRRGPRPRNKQDKDQTQYRSSVPVVDEDIKREMSEDEYSENLVMSWQKDKEETAFASFLRQLGTTQFELPTGVDADIEIVRHCLDMFFTHVNCQTCEFIDGPEFLENLIAGKVQPCLLNAMCAVSARFSKHPSLYTQPRYLAGTAFAKAAREQCKPDQPIFRPWVVQTLAILSQHAFSLNQGARAWLDLGAAIRVAQIISLKFDPDSARYPQVPEVSRKELKTFARIAKALYVMERLMIAGTPYRPTMILNPDLFYNIVDVKTESPDFHAVASPVDNPWRMSDESPHIIGLVDVWEQISLFEREGFANMSPPPWHSQSRFQQLRLALDDWMLQLPRDLEFSSQTLALRVNEGKGAQLVFLHCLYHHCNIILNRVFLPILPWKQEFGGASMVFLKERRNKCIDSAASISIIAEEAIQTKSFIIPPFMGYCLFQSSIIYIHRGFCTSEETAAEVKRDLRSNLEILRIFNGFYEPAATWLQTIRELYEVHLEWRTRLCPIGVATLAQQFRRYFDRFEGRIREPPFAVYDDLAYTEGNSPERPRTSPSQADIEHFGTMLMDPNEDGFGKRIRGFANDMGNPMPENLTFDSQLQWNDLLDLYNLPTGLPEQQPMSQASETVESLFQNTNPIGSISESFGSASLSPAVRSPFNLRNVQTSSQHSRVGSTQGTMDDVSTYLLPQGGRDGWDALFGDMPDISGMHGTFESAFLDYLNAPQ